MSREYTSIKISLEAKEVLDRTKGLLQYHSGKRTVYSDAVELLCNYYLEREGPIEKKRGAQ